MQYKKLHTDRLSRETNENISVSFLGTSLEKHVKYIRLKKYKYILMKLIKLSTSSPRKLTQRIQHSHTILTLGISDWNERETYFNTEEIQCLQHNFPAAYKSNTPMHVNGTGIVVYLHLFPMRSGKRSYCRGSGCDQKASAALSGLYHDCKLCCRQCCSFLFQQIRDGDMIKSLFGMDFERPKAVYGFVWIIFWEVFHLTKRDDARERWFLK